MTAIIYHHHSYMSDNQRDNSIYIGTIYICESSVRKCLNIFQTAGSCALFNLKPNSTLTRQKQGCACLVMLGVCFEDGNYTGFWNCTIMEARVSNLGGETKYSSHEIHPNTDRFTAHLVLVYRRILLNIFGY